MELFKVYVEEESGICYYIGGIIVFRSKAEEVAREAFNKPEVVRVSVEVAYCEFNEETVFSK